MSASIYPINAMKDAGVSVAAVLVDERIVVFENGVRVPIRLLDRSDGDEHEVDDPEDATHYEFGDKQFGFGMAKLFLDEEEYQTEH